MSDLKFSQLAEGDILIIEGRRVRLCRVNEISTSHVGVNFWWREIVYWFEDEACPEGSADRHLRFSADTFTRLCQRGQIQRVSPELVGA